MTEQSLPSIDIVLDEARRALDYQFELIHNLDNKSGIVLGITGVILVLVVTNLLGRSDIASNLLVVKAAIVPILLSLILSLVTIIIKKWNKPPNLARLRSYYIVQEAEETKLRIVDVFLDAIRKNDRRIKMKTNLLQYSYLFLVIGLVLFAIWTGLTL